MKSPLSLKAVLLAVAAVLSFQTLSAAPWKQGEPLPNLAQYGLEGKLPDLKGKVVYLDFWASWCGPCKASFPVLDRWQRTLGPKGLIVVGISVDEGAAAAEKFVRAAGIAFPTLRDGAHKLVAAADVSAMPTSFLIDRKGVIRVVHHGFRNGDEAALSAQIEALLAEH